MAIITRAKALGSGGWGFLRNELWTMDLAKLDRYRRLGYAVLRVVVLSVRGFIVGQIRNRAAALTLVTVLSLVPLLAVSFSIAKGLGFTTQLRTSLLKAVSPSPGAEQNVATQAVQGQIGQVISYVEQTDFTVVGIFGVAGVFFGMLSLMTRMERAFNEVWQVSQARGIMRRLTDYTSSLILIPPLIFTGTAITAPLSNRATVADILGKIAGLLPGDSGHALTQPLAVFIVQSTGILLALIAACLAFVFLYMFLPNTKVRFKPAFIAGLLTGLLWEVTQTVFAATGVGISRYNAVYGALASFPIFLIWLWLAWTVILFGAVIAHAVQEVMEGHALPFATVPSIRWRGVLATRVLLALVDRFVKGEPALSAKQASDELALPLPLVEALLVELKNAGLAVEAAPSGSFVPARSPDMVTVRDVIQTLHCRGDEAIPLPLDGLSTRVKGLLESGDEARGGVLAKLTLRQAVEKLGH